MAFYRKSGVSVESWVEMRDNVPMSYEVSVLNDNATLYFGQNHDYVLSLDRSALTQVAALAQQAVADLDKPVRQEEEAK